MGGYSCCLINEVGRKKRSLETFLFTRKPKGAEDEFLFSCVLFRSFHASISATTTLDLSLCCEKNNYPFDPKPSAGAPGGPPEGSSKNKKASHL